MPTQGLTIQQALQQAVEHQNHGRFAEAEKLYRMILERGPDQPEVLHLLGLVAHQTGRNEMAEELIRKAIQSAPEQGKYHASLGVVLSVLGRFDEAARAFEEGIRVAPDDAAISGNLGIVLCRLERYGEAVEHLNRAIVRQPGVADFHAALANALHQLDQNEAALAAGRQAIAIDRSNGHARQTLSRIFSALRRFLEAAAEAKLAAEALPDVAEMQITYGDCLEKLGRLDDAGDVYRKALERHPESAMLHNNLANVVKQQGRLDEALDEYRRAMAAEPRFVEAHSNLLFALQFHPHMTPGAIFQEHRRFNELHALPLEPAERTITHDRAAKRRLRVGYVGMQFVAGYHLYPLLAHHDKSRFEIFGYSNTPYPDEQTENFRRCCDHWCDIRRLSDAQVAEQVRSDQIDILVDLSLHMGNNRILVFARKPAPVQISYFGYPGTTGLTAIDYRITDRHLEPLNAPPESVPSSEVPLHLSDSFWCYQPRVDIPVNPLPAESAGHITFGNLNNFWKIHEPTMGLWADILRGVARSRLLMMTTEGRHRQRVRGFFEQRGIAAERIEFVPFLPPEQYFRVYQKIDVGLDSFPYNGHTTSLDAFYMGVPVLTIVGTTPVSRAGWSQLVNMGLPELAAATPGDFVKLAVNLANDRARLAALRKGLRSRMAGSPLMDPERYARNVEELYLMAWQDGSRGG